MNVEVLYLFFILYPAYVHCHSSFEGSAVVCEPGFAADQCDAASTCVNCTSWVTQYTPAATLLLSVNVPCPDKACKNGGICHGTSSYMRCICPRNWAGPYCEKAVTQCPSDSICNGLGTCFIRYGQMKCACNWLYDGKRCEIRVKPFGCNRDVCLHGSCITTEHDVPGCKCFEGYTGSSCEIKISACESSPCRNNGKCISRESEYFCKCIDGFRGINCQTPSCKPRLCVHGTCRNLEDGYTCHCVEGFKGKHCSEIVESCHGSPCLNEGTCENDGINFHCLCTADYTGRRCEKFVGSRENSSEASPKIYMHEKNINEEYEEADIGRIMGICITVICTIVLFWWAVIKYRRTRTVDLDLSMVSHSDDEENLIDPISVWQGPPPLRWIPISKYATCKHGKASNEVVKSSHVTPDDETMEVSTFQRSHSCGPPVVAKEQCASRSLHRSASR